MSWIIGTETGLDDRERNGVPLAATSRRLSGGEAERLEEIDLVELSSLEQ
jgi:hypothetical protein